MEALQRVLAQSTGDLARVLQQEVGIQEAAARRFVQVAGAELLASYQWQRASLDVDRLSDARNARELLSTVAAGRIATQVGISRTEAWSALRAFVPSVLELAEGREAAPRAAAADMARRWARRARAAPFEFMQPME